MKNWKLYIVVIVATFAASCTDVIDVTLPEGDPLIVFDAFLNNQDEVQTIKITNAVPYFDNEFSPAVNDAIVTITDNSNNVFNFIENGNSGIYEWTDTSGNGFGMIGDTYELRIEIDGAVYTANSAMNRITTIDSITFETFDPEFITPKEEGFTAQFYARDLVGVGDAVWIRTYKNGQLLNKPQEIRTAYDAGFDSGSEIDGLVFIEPIREFINRVPDQGDDATDTNEFPPYRSDDSIRVELHSLTEGAFNFLREARAQMLLGNAGIFAEPLVNVPSNIVSPTNATKGVGFFSVSAVSSFEEVVP